MKREILFRVYDLDSKEYLKGDFSIGVESSEIRGKYGEVFENLIIEQFTGLTDKNGVKIFNGDKIKIWSFYHESGNTSDWFGAEPQNSQPCYEEFLETMYATVEFKNGSFIAKNTNHEITLNEVIKGLGSEVSHFYLCGYGGSELNFIECLDDIESYPKNYYDELKSLEGDKFYNRLEEIVNEITQEIEIIGNIHDA